MGDEGRFPCRFGYKVGDEFIYDGERFIGRICPGILIPMAPVIKTMQELGNKLSQNSVYKYSGLVRRDASMKKYDGVGYAPIQKFPAGTDKKYTANASPVPSKKGIKGWPIACQDSRILALFNAEIIGLSDKGMNKPYYRREMQILKKVKDQPGIYPAAIFKSFTKWERENIFPPLTQIMFDVLVEELIATGFIEMRAKKLFLINNSSI